MSDRSKESWSSIITRGILLAGFIAAIFYTLNLFGSTGLTARESTLLGVLLTICSVVASWLITHLYAAKERRDQIREVQEKNQASLRTFGLKAAEKVNNLSTELQKLSIYLEDELNFTDYPSADVELSAKEERIESAIHIIRTLKSVNDTSLSDWQGVIGEELDEQKQHRLEKEEQLATLIDQVDTLLQRQHADLVGSQESEQTMRQELQTLKSEIRAAMSELGGPTILSKVERKGKREDVSAHCPACGSLIAYRQRRKPGSVKPLTCDNCHQKLVGRYSDEQGHYIEIRGPKEELVQCPNCGAENKAWIDNLLSSSTNGVCVQCGKLFRASRSKHGITARNISTTPPSETSVPVCDEALIERVRAALPAQPWPTGTHKTVAKELKLPPKIVSQAINQLMVRGIFRFQIGGKLYEPIAVVSAPVANADGEAKANELATPESGESRGSK
jgi:hypothetical protein